jgi:2-C-methyl-D-erythritol 4-phosphate cytidylyltransferase
MSTGTDDAAPALGTIVDEGRGALPYALIHGESLVACAAWALGDAQVTGVDLGTQWAGLVDSGEPFVVHDALCPMTPAAFIAACVARSAESGAVVAAVDDAGTVLSPVVLPGAVVAELTDLPSTDFAELVRRLEERFAVERLLAPAAAARVSSLADVAALELLTAPETTPEPA